jgi:hypothetical protein
LLNVTANGGSEAGKLLKDAVVQYISRLSPELGDCRIVARVYANLKSLDRNEKGSRTLAGFAAVFSRESSFFDFINIASEEIVKSKIVGM